MNSVTKQRTISTDSVMSVDNLNKRWYSRDMENTTPTLEQFEELVARFDITYSYSDDFSVWKAGSNAFDKIKQMTKQLPEEDVVRIWNKYVDLKIVEDSREYFYWHPKER